MVHAEQSLQYALYELIIAFYGLTASFTEYLPKPLRFIYTYSNDRLYDAQRNLAEYINEFY